MTPIDTKYFRDYREKLGFTNQNEVKVFFGAKDIISRIDYEYIGSLNLRLAEIIQKIHALVAESVRVDDIRSFCDKNIQSVFEKLRENDIISRLNNQGRRPEEVYFSWMRGFVVSSYFLRAIGQIFGVDKGNISFIGDDDFAHVELFKRTPKADLQVQLLSGEKVRIEIQSGFQGINDIKQHKVLEARKIKQENGISSLVIHFDIFNGQVAFIHTDTIEDESVNWITRVNLDEGLVWNIDQNFFFWTLGDTPASYREIMENYCT